MNDLVLSAKNGNRDALLQLYGKYKNGIYYFCSKLIDEKQKAEEICFDTFTCAFEKISTLSDTDQFELWLKNIAAIKCFNYIRKMKPMLFLQVVGDTKKSLFSEEEIIELPKGELDKSNSTGVMDAIFTRLNDDQRMTLMLRYYNGLTVAQIAKIMSSGEQAIKARLANAAETMKNNIEILEKNDIKLTPVDFKTVMGLMAALTSVPKSIDVKIEDIVDIYANEDIIDVSSDPAAFPTIKEPEFGTLEEATLKYSAGAAETESTTSAGAPSLPLSRETRERVFEKFMDNPVPRSETHDFSAFEEKPKTKKIEPPQKKKKIVIKLNKKFKITAGAIAVIIILIIIISSFAKCSSKDSAASSSNTSSVASKQTVSVVREPVVKDPKAATVSVRTVDFNDSLKADDGTVLAEVKYTCPEVDIPDFTDSADKINQDFIKERDSILATYSSEDEKLKCNYMYEHQSYGAFKKNFTYAEVENTRAGNGLVSFSKTYRSYTYGNTHDETETHGATYSVESGKQLKLSSLFSDYDRFYSFATEYANGKLEDKKDKGELILYDDYSTTVSRAFDKKDSWYFTADSFVLVFNPDEVAYYDYGIIKIEIPLAEITEFLKEDYK